MINWFLRLFFVPAVFFLPVTVWAQVSDTVSMKPVEITGSRSSIFSSGRFITVIDSAALAHSEHQSVGELLGSSSTAFIKSYGSGGSATISSRGTEARHNAILWNGFNINSATLGLTDLSLVPATVGSGIKIIHGGSSPLNGNSAIGSTIILEPYIPSFQKALQFHAAIEAGSFGHRNLNLTNQIGTSFLESRTTLFAQYSNNDFEYDNIAKRDHPKEKQHHAETRSYGLLQNFDFKIKKNQFVSLGLWYQVNRREIPPLMTVPESFAVQRDSNLRIFAGYRLVKNKSQLNVKAAWFRENQFYVDSVQKLDLSYPVNSYLSDVEWRWFINSRIILSNGISYTKSTASFLEYSRNRNLERGSLFSAVAFLPFRGWRLNFTIRKEIASAANPPLSPSLGIEGILRQDLITITGNIGRHYNLPGMNDLYWVPGGNPDLKPENAWSGEVGLIFLKNKNRFPTLSTTWFRSKVDNWIKWQPGPGGIYTPDNLRQVKTEGIEATLRYHSALRWFHVSADVSYTWCLSYLTKSNDIYSAGIIGEQLVYIPEHTANAVINFRAGSFSVNYRHTFTGERFVTADHSQVLPSYHVADFSLEKIFYLKKNRISAYAAVVNLYNASYQVLAYRPTPGRWFKGGIKYTFNLTKQKQNLYEPN